MKSLSARKRIQIQGVVQGVGFRPLCTVSRKFFDIRGYVLNSSEGVVIEAEADEGSLFNKFDRRAGSRSFRRSPGSTN